MAKLIKPSKKGLTKKEKSGKIVTLSERERRKTHRKKLLKSLKKYLTKWKWFDIIARHSAKSGVGKRNRTLGYIRFDARKDP